MAEYSVKFMPGDKTVRVAQGADLLDAAIRCGIALHAACGGEGICGKCRCIVTRGTVKAIKQQVLINEEDKLKGVVLACQSLIESDLEVTVPPESLEIHKPLNHAAEEFTKGIVLKRESAFTFSPLVKRVCKEGASKTTVTLGYNGEADEMLSVAPGDVSGSNFGFAFDIGTTTVVGQLIDLKTKDILGSRIAFNKQANFGSDVITRIVYAQEPGGLKKLNEVVLENINEIIKDLMESHKVNLSDVYAAVFAGNMTMMHLLLNIDPSEIRRPPYMPSRTVFPAIRASESSIGINPKGQVSFLPGVSSYVGGDIVSGVVACGLSEADEISLLVDIGTNGEIVLGNKEWMISAAASAGPAFEGSGLGFGMKAVSGAIQKVVIDEGLNVKIDTIGGDKPRGICGSGYIDLLCQMLKRKIIGKDGKINRSLKSGRIRKGENNYEFVVSEAKENSILKDIVINEDDVENLKRSKGAIYSAIISLLNKVDKNAKDLKKIFIAGGFGNYLNIENAIFLGLLPDVDRSVYEFIGNSSLAGARMSLVSREAFKYANNIYKNITYADLSSDPNYMDEYIGALFFPHTDARRFPSVRL